MPSYIFVRLRTSDILYHSTAIVTNMIKSAAPLSDNQFGVNDVLKKNEDWKLPRLKHTFTDWPHTS